MCNGEVTLEIGPKLRISISALGISPTEVGVSHKDNGKGVMVGPSGVGVSVGSSVLVELGFGLVLGDGFKGGEGTDSWFSVDGLALARSAARVNATKVGTSSLGTGVGRSGPSMPVQPLMKIARVISPHQIMC